MDRPRPRGHLRAFAGRAVWVGIGRLPDATPGLRLRWLATALVACLLAGSLPGARAQTASPAALDGDAMWIWQLRRSSGGNLAAIVDRARRHSIEAVIVKGADGGMAWRQFSPRLIRRLKAAGLRVCAWQFVYGRRPRDEAALGARLAQAGADCLVIDAEGRYEGRYAQAQIYLRRLRARLGPDYPLALASFPYIHYHPAFPYSVFLGPGGAQLNAPQMYWKAIGTSVDRVFSTTYRYNRFYGRPILPLGQVWMHPAPRQLRRFRQLALAHGARGLSWWDWQEAAERDWRALADPLPPLPAAPAPPGYPLLARRARGDLVVWAQQHLRAAGLPVSVDGVFGRRTEGAVRSFQALAGLPRAGRVGPRTWRALLRHSPARVSWTWGGRARAALATGARGGPASARLAARRNELGGRPH